MKKIILLAIMTSSVFAGYAQQLTDPGKFNNSRNRITRNGMIALGSWSAVNLVYSGIATGQTTGTTRYFHQMNVMWGGINLGLAALGYFGLKNESGLGFIQSLKKQAGIEKTYLLNLGLDAAYITSGFYLKERAKNSTSNYQKFKGYGESIILQGAALLVLDAVMFGMHNIHGRKLYKMAEKTSIGFTGSGLGVVVKF